MKYSIKSATQTLPGLVAGLERSLAGLPPQPLKQRGFRPRKDCEDKSLNVERLYSRVDADKQAIIAFCIAPSTGIVSQQVFRQPRIGGVIELSQATDK